MRRTKEQAEITRKKILRAAREIFCREGYSSTRLEEVAKKAGVTRGAIYWHFGDKYKLFVSLLDEGFRGYSKRIVEIINGDASPVTKIRNLMKEALISLDEDKKYRSALELYSLKAEFTEKRARQWEELQKQQEELQQRLMSVPEAHQWLRKAVEDLIQEGIVIGEIVPDIDPKLAALALMSYLSGVQSTWLDDPQAFSGKETPDELVEFILSRIINPKGRLELYLKKHSISLEKPYQKGG
ncbi:MAG: TetR family transcriptional regulator [Deltaproteobacteria bacterium]|nr:TetR family transcriptional regulator [Deltaproteobacteria bacterium]